MELTNSTVIATGGASGLGLGAAREFAAKGAHVVIVDLPVSKGAEIAEELGGTFVAADVTNSDEVAAAVATAEGIAPIRVLVHCAGRGGSVRVLEKDGSPGDQELFDTVVRVNLSGTYNVLRHVAASMVKNDPIEGERGVCILTSSIAASEGQISQTPYAASKAGVVGMTIVSARELARHLVRVNTISPGIFDTPIFSRFSQEIIDGLEAQVPHPARLGRPDEFGQLASAIVDNAMINGETIRLDGAMRMSAR